MIKTITEITCDLLGHVYHKVDNMNQEDGRILDHTTLQVRVDRKWNGVDFDEEYAEAHVSPEAASEILQRLFVDYMDDIGKQKVVESISSGEKFCKVILNIANAIKNKSGSTNLTDDITPGTVTYHMEDHQ